MRVWVPPVFYRQKVAPYEHPDLLLQYISFFNQHRTSKCAPTNIASTWEGRKQSPEMLIKLPNLTELRLEPRFVQFPFQASTIMPLVRNDKVGVGGNATVNRNCETSSHNRFSEQVLYDPNVGAACVRVNSIHSLLNSLMHIDCQLKFLLPTEQ